jgi:exopolysaccharide biosynthesis polyprenyl glycosylphosphotransferase
MTFGVTLWVDDILLEGLGRQIGSMIKVFDSNGAGCEAFFPNRNATATASRLKRLSLGIWKRRRYILILLDATVVLIAFLVAYMIRFQTGLQDVFTAKEQLDFEAYFISAYVRAGTIFSILWVVLMERDGLYSRRLISASSHQTENRQIFWDGIQATAILMAISFLFRGFLLSRFVYVMSLALSACGMIAVRALGRRLISIVVNIGVPPRRTLVIGTAPLAIEFASTLKTKSNGFQEVVGFLEFPDERCSKPESAPGCKILGNVNEIDVVRSKIEFDRIVVSAADFIGPNEQNRETLLMRILNYCEAYAIPLYLISFSTDVLVLRSEMGSYHGIPLLLLRDSAQHPVYSIVKRILDIVISAVVLIVGFPIWLLIAIVIKMTSPGPVLYVQERAGMNGKSFKMLKFRSMDQDADQQLSEMLDFSKMPEPVFKIHNDPRITRFGSCLRKSSLDEIPQLINVLKGDMSLVGPRPEQIELVRMYNDHQWRRLKIKPGVTGYQQIKSRGDLSLAHRIEYDLVYLKNQSIWLDLYIMCRTVIVVVRGEGT